jgi:phosphoadenosine phosphosulfate reductase
MVVISRDLERASAEEILTWALDTYRGRVALACSFGGPTGIVAIDMVMRIDPTTPVYYLDTGLLFEQTHALVARIRKRYAIEPIPVRAALSLDDQRDRYGDALWATDPDRCCDLRKISPQREFLRDYAAWISGVRHDQTVARQQIPVVGWDEQFALIKISPFASWSEAMVWQYVREHELAYNDLHDRNYPSVGCIPCTRAVRAGEGPRDGRWPGSGKVECGLHIASTVRGNV